MIELNLQTSIDQYNAIYQAAKGFNRVAMWDLVKRGCSLDINLNGQTPAAQLISEDNDAAADFLLNFGSSIHHQVECYAKLNNLNRVERLEAMGANPNYAAKGFAFAHNHEEVCKRTEILIINNLPIIHYYADVTFILTGFILSGDSAEQALEHLSYNLRPHFYADSSQIKEISLQRQAIIQPIENLKKIIQNNDELSVTMTALAEIGNLVKCYQLISYFNMPSDLIYKSLLKGFVIGGHDDLAQQIKEIELPLLAQDAKNLLPYYIVKNTIEAGHIHRAFALLEAADKKASQQFAHIMLTPVFDRGFAASIAKIRISYSLEKTLYFSPSKKSSRLLFKDLLTPPQYNDAPISFKKVKKKYKAMSKFKERYQTNYAETVLLLHKNIRHLFAVGIILDRLYIIPMDVFSIVIQYLLPYEVENLSSLIQAISAHGEKISHPDVKISDKKTGFFAVMHSINQKISSVPKFLQKKML